MAMEVRVLGRTGLPVSPLGFGGAPMGLQGYLSSEDRDSPAFRAQALQAVRAAVDAGITLFDTAPGYGDGRSERLLGEGLAGVRDQIVLATKFPAGPDWTPESATRGLEESLGRLRTDRVDLLQIHGERFDDASAEWILKAGVIDWAEAMRAAGKCRFIGVTAEGPSGGLEHLLRTGRFHTLQILFNVLYQSTCDHQREPAGVAVLARSLGMGVLAMRAATSGLLPRILAAEFPGLDPGRVVRLALRFVLSVPEIDCALVGMRTAGEVRANAAVAADPAARLDLRGLHDRFA